MEKDKTLIVRPLVGVILILLVLGYIVSVVLKANFTQIKTETANIMTVSDAISSKGYFIRTEHLISHEGDGYISYTVDDGEKVKNKGAVAYVYSDPDSASDNSSIEKLEANIKELEQLENTKDVISATPDELDKSIDADLSKLNQSVCSRNFSDAEALRDSLLHSINERQLVTGKTTGFSERINTLKARLEEMQKGTKKSEKGKAVKTPASGYFVSSADGYEGKVDVSKVKEIMPGDLNFEKIKADEVSEDVIGKTIEGVYWYVACEVSADDALKIKGSDFLQIELPLVNSELIDVDVYSINQKTMTSDAVIILRGNYMNKEMAQTRYEDISIVVHSYTGIYISKKAVHELTLSKEVEDKKGRKKTVTKDVTGVYIKIGNEILFKEIFPIYTGEDFVICKKELGEKDELFSDDIGPLKPYDNVVVEGANLYDGKIIDRTN